MGKRELGDIPAQGSISLFANIGLTHRRYGWGDRGGIAPTKDHIWVFCVSPETLALKGVSCSPAANKPVCGCIHLNTPSAQWAGYFRESA